ncbi:dihydropteroate synthase [Terrihabitans soli]|uniref:Dihydropteroate synthase n=2 Tax=Terrihabitans soli TaxID=708113 RepID=A0A6S6QTK6_9HYPH|nr:dihydropteroate synthase [Terrihabitans soli]
MEMSRIWRFCDLDLPIGPRTLLMGVLNITPDSFSDGGDFLAPDTARIQAAAMARDGADLIDIGGESTRPGAEKLSAEDEIARVLPVLEALRGRRLPPLSIDTYKAKTARAALEAGATIVNDVWGLRYDTEMARVVADFGAGIVLMHNRETVDETLDIMDDVKRFLDRSLSIAMTAGIADDRIVLDPGVGFGKTPRQSAEVITRLGEVAALGFPVLLGASRKRFIGHILRIDNPKDRLNGTLGAHLAGVSNGADIIRAHDIKPHREALDVFDAVRRPE